MHVTTAAKLAASFRKASPSIVKIEAQQLKRSLSIGTSCYIADDIGGVLTECHPGPCAGALSLLFLVEQMFLSRTKAEKVL